MIALITQINFNDPSADIRSSFNFFWKQRIKSYINIENNCNAVIHFLHWKLTFPTVPLLLFFILFLQRTNSNWWKKCFVFGFFWWGGEWERDYEEGKSGGREKADLCLKFRCVLRLIYFRKKIHKEIKNLITNTIVQSMFQYSLESLRVLPEL